MKQLRIGGKGGGTTHLTNQDMALKTFLEDGLDKTGDAYSLFKPICRPW